MIRRETDTSFINRIANLPGVREFVHARGEVIDLSPAVGRITHTGVVFVSNGEDALAAFEQTADQVFQSHTMFGPTCRGRRAIDTARAMVAWMFEHGARIVWGATPRTNRKAIWFNRQIGARELPTSDAETAIFEIRKEAY